MRYRIEMFAQPVFADTGYWIALLDRTDQQHGTALELAKTVETCKLRVITSEMVLVEFLNFFTRSDAHIRQQMADWVIQIKRDPNVRVIGQNSELFDQAIEKLVSCVDKQWSLTDCSSFILMTELEILYALAHDKHFEQAGFIALMRGGQY